ncbi:hypothetical protein BHE90_003219 [Fusarium euwallaceae]|uniref:Peptidase C14 caspase domain-containing protein n=1 Tax=Fusarium euwallaceae TaxID=1147111 RepID=A0A430M2M7_9HYPO|nr:hypothetical protein BHE90_003219 [Fusarium euwallaceae]
MNDTPNKVWAILVGIDTYPGDFPLNLYGCVRDVENVESFLLSHFRNDSLQILKITSVDPCEEKQPTFDNITRTINEVKDQVKPNDFVYFHYSGHGGRQLRSGNTQNSGPEVSADDYVECLVLHGNRHLKDYELGGHFCELAETGAILFAVLDCCHSGGADRVDNRNIRQIDRILPADGRPGEPIEAISSATKAAHRAASIRPSYWTKVRKYTLLTACHPHQFAKECADSMGEMNGTLTLTMLASIQRLLRSNQPLTYESLYGDIRATIGSKSSRQNPILFGEKQRLLFSLDDGLASRHAMVVTVATDASQNMRVTIDQGEIHGLQCGEEWRIYPPGQVNLADPIATLTIDQVWAIRASGFINANVQGIEPGCLVALISPVYGQRLQVIVQDDALRQDLINREDIGVQFQAADYQGAHYEIRPDDEGQHQIMDASATPLTNRPSFQPGLPGAARIHEFLRTLAHYWRVLKLQNTRADLRGEFEFSVKDGTTHVRDGGSIKLRFRNLREPKRILGEEWDNETNSLLFSVLNLRADRKVALLIPDPDSEPIWSIPVAPEASYIRMSQD